MNDITIEELRTRKLNNENLTIIDVREVYEFEEFNIDAINIPLGELLQKLDELPKDKTTEIILHCRSGQRSAVAKEMLKAQGYNNCRNLLGGMIQWQTT